jgi:hypothetical protein
MERRPPSPLSPTSGADWEERENTEGAATMTATPRGQYYRWMFAPVKQKRILGPHPAGATWLGGKTEKHHNVTVSQNKETNVAPESQNHLSSLSASAHALGTTSQCEFFWSLRGLNVLFVFLILLSIGCFRAFVVTMAHSEGCDLSQLGNRSHIHTTEIVLEGSAFRQLVSFACVAGVWHVC